jgi:hypothetical protein
MPEGSKGISAGGIVGGATAIATAIAAVLGVANQLGYIGGHEESKPPVIIVATPVAVASPAPLAATPALPVAQASKAAPVAQANATPAHHKHVHKPKPPPVEEAASSDEPAAKPSVIARETPAVEAAAAVASAPSPAAAPPPPEAPKASASLAMIEPPEHGIAGAWVDESIGACHLINVSSDTSFSVTNYDPSTGEVMSYGDGTIDGNHVSIIFRGHRVMADFHISQSHNTLYGKITRPSGIFRSLWRYTGTACQKPSG